MTAVKQWIAFFLLMLASASASASIPLMTLVLPDGQQVTLDEAALSALPQTEFTTTTPWTQGTHHYRGPTLSAVLAAQGIPDARRSPFRPSTAISRWWIWPCSTACR